jgi:hypothetical protein
LRNAGPQAFEPVQLVSESDVRCEHKRAAGDAAL